MTVYIVHPLRPDNSDELRKWGPLRDINQRFIYMDELTPDNDPPASFQHAMEKAVRTFDPQTDYIAILGDTLQVVMMTALLAARFDSFRVLRYERTEKAYVPVSIHSNLVAGSAGVLSSEPQTGVKHGQDRREGGESRDAEQSYFEGIRQRYRNDYDH